MKSIGVEFLRPDALPGVNHMRGMHLQIVLNIKLQLYKCVCTIPIQKININLRSKPPFSRLLRHTWVKAVMQFYAHTTNNNNLHV